MEANRYHRLSELHDLIIESAQDYAIFTLDNQRKITSWNIGAQRLLGWEASEIIGQPGDVVFTLEDRARAAPERETEIATIDGRAQNERFHLRKDGSEFWGTGIVMPLRDGTGWVKIMRDGSAAKRAEQERKLLIAELGHRMKNMLALVIAISDQSSRTATDLKSFRTVFSDRIIALARAQDAVMLGDGLSTDIGDIARAGLAPWLSTGQVRLEGEPVIVPADRAIPISVMLHELACNAVKYGALSVAEGRVDLRWQKQEGKLFVVWQENDGPQVAPPARQGFGSKVLHDAIKDDLGRGPKVEFLRKGVRCEFTVPLATEKNS